MTWINPKKLDEILSRHGPALVLYARQWSPLPDDALQEALCDLVQTDVAPNDIISWLYKVIRCKAMNLSRSERRRNGYQRNAAEQRDEWFENSHEFIEEVNELENHLKQLPELGREIVVARIWGDLSFEQIAALTGKPSSTVHRHYQHSLAQLRSLIGKSLETRQ